MNNEERREEKSAMAVKTKTNIHLKRQDKTATHDPMMSGAATSCCELAVISKSKSPIRALRKVIAEY